MSAPSKANISKLENPARVAANHRHGTKHAYEEATNYTKPWGGQNVSHNASEGIEPRNYPYCIGSRVSFPGNQYQDTR
ncbi:hypothetical protein BMS3Abin10_02566 [bacterium BMS3Abin10]|nr:hypothetical protein BMS3Abin10_02566 [bacterium BMS3Abin10]